MIERHLRILGQKVRIDILKKLDNSLVPLSFSTLQKEICDLNQSNINLSFHLRTLKEANLIESIEEGYQITILGKKILNNIILMEQILNAQNKTIMIRTSKYSKEPFNIKKIEEYLIREGEMEEYQAKQIASEVQERLSKTKIDYLTAPLMREYINAILLENGLEKVRHKLTRLGTPPYEAIALFEDAAVNPEQFLERLGSDVSEQLLLLNFLPNPLADLYLSGEIVFLNLNQWALRPLSFYINTESILNYIKKSGSLKIGELSTLFEYVRVILEFHNTISLFKPFFSGDMVLGNFDRHFLSHIPFKNQELINLLVNQLCNLSKSITLDFSCEYNHHLNELFFLSLNSLIDSKENNNIPLVLLDNSNLNMFESNLFSCKLIPKLKNSFIFCNKNSCLLNSSIINLKLNHTCNLSNNKIVLDKILINLHSIALQSNQNDDIFYELITDRLSKLFELYKIKVQLVSKKLSPLREWEKVTQSFFNDKGLSLLKNSIKSVSFFGLNKAVKTHCGIELDRIDTSHKFALKVITLMNKIVNETAQDENENYILSQPHNDEYLYTPTNIINTGLEEEEFKGYSMNIIRTESNLPLENQISLFKKFELKLNGGAIFNYYLAENDQQAIKNFIDVVGRSKLSAFRFY
ncbi:MAG: anaerobic ribonucleoside-triphosphate reductase [Promethearchaeota archaeon]